MNEIEEGTIKLIYLDYQLSLQLKKKVNLSYLNIMYFPMSVTEVNSLKYISTNAAILLVN